MSFERIGPYNLTRRDLVAAANIVFFLTEARSVRLVVALNMVLGLLMIAGGLVFGDWVFSGIGVAFVFLVFVIAPAFRTLNRSREMYLEYSPEGIIAETPQIRSTFKWSTIGRMKKVGSRLFIMVTERNVLVVPERSTSSDNMERLVETLSHERAARHF